MWSENTNCHLQIVGVYIVFRAHHILAEIGRFYEVLNALSLATYLKFHVKLFMCTTTPPNARISETEALKDIETAIKTATCEYLLVPSSEDIDLSPKIRFKH